MDAASLWEEGTEVSAAARELKQSGTPSKALCRDVVLLTAAYKAVQLFQL